MVLIREENTYAKDNPPDFITHLNYVVFLNELSNKLTLNYTKPIAKPIEDIKIISNKVNLVNLTMKGLASEYETVVKYSEYAPVCVSWISVKSYYTIFNLCLLLKYLITGEKNAFNSTHMGILSDLRGYIERKELSFNSEHFNMLHPCKTILNWKCVSGANIKVHNIDVSERYLQILKKLSRYVMDEYKRQNKIENLRSAKNKALMNSFLSKRTIGIYEFFYWYRIKANYRDLEYLNKDIHDDNFRNYYVNYYGLTTNFHLAFKQLINSLSQIRLKRVLFH